jgi:hypothetical protein
VLLDAAGGGLAERFAGFGPGLDVVGASDLGIADRPEWAGIRAVLLRPDGHITWVGAGASEASAARLGPALARWLDSLPERYAS